MSARTGIKCDGCGSEHTADSLYMNASQVRAALKRRGWHKTRGTYMTVGGTERGYSRDICPACWDGGKR